METKNWIGGESVLIQDQGQIVYSPSNLSEEVGVIHYSERSHVFQAEEAAKQAFRTWSKLTGVTRASYLYQMANVLEKNQTELATLACREMGKPITEMMGEVTRAIHLLRYYAAEGVRSDGELIPASDVNVLQYSKRVPLGVVGVITPWNFPVAIPIWKIAPALICGNTVIWKPADNAALTASKMMEFFSEVNLPEGVLNLVIGKGSVIGVVLLEEVDFQAVSFTGSTSTGTHVASICAKRNIKYQTEMGGKNAAVVLNDANLEITIPIILSGAYRSAGQKCTATSRIIVEEGIYPRFVERLREAVSGLKAVHALEPTAYLGPVASKSQFETVSHYVNLAHKEAEIIAEGTIKSDNDGYFIHPLLVTGVQTDHSLVQEEIFGPVSVLLQAANFDEAIQLSNETIYGLSASVFTNDLSKAHRFLEEAQAGMVRVNQETAGVEYQAPFGGMKHSSSHTREQGQAALSFYTTVKTCAIKHTF
ncbi:aldehyde dehydrogenase family protein [Bacillus sp. 1P02SD]|uniref:aldehyde dehydrogenase family protein n=1 Tax=Bacillus sp. 1P02SD TaxID=3132264 RepID=UPI0039A27EA2